MRQAIQIVVTVSWALWFGASVALFVFVQYLFAQDRSLAVEAAPKLFHIYGRISVAFAAVALVGAFAWRLIRPVGVVNALFLMLTLAAAAAVTFSLYLLPRMEALRESGEGTRDQFAQLHGISMAVLSSGTALLLLAGCTIPFVIVKVDRMRFLGQSAPPAPSKPFEEPPPPVDLPESPEEP